MSGDHEIRDAVRQLGRAIGTLARAVVSAVLRTRPAAPAQEAESGPPQEWLDLVAETDPGWLARSRWADQARRAGKDRARSFGGGRRARDARTEPVPEPSRTDELWPDAVPPELDGLPMGRRERTSSVEEPSRVAVPAGQERRAPGTQPRLRRLLPVDPRGEAADTQDDLPPRVRPTDRREATARNTQRLDPGAQPGDSRPNQAEGPADRVADGAVREQARLGPYSPLDAPRPGPLRPLPDLPVFERVRPEPERDRAARPSSPLHAVVHELPGTWTRAPLEEPRTAPVPSERLSAAFVPGWPELPHTEGLDDAAAQAGPGLAAQLWQADASPDALTAAQRRS